MAVFIDDHFMLIKTLLNIVLSIELYNSQLQIWLDPKKILTKGFSVVYSSIRCT